MSPLFACTVAITVIVARQNELAQAGWGETPEEKHALNTVLTDARLWAEFFTICPQQATEFVETQKVSRLLVSNKDRT